MAAQLPADLDLDPGHRRNPGSHGRKTSHPNSRDWNAQVQRQVQRR